jgi:hypothetical protein
MIPLIHTLAPPVSPPQVLGSSHRLVRLVNYNDDQIIRGWYPDGVENLTGLHLDGVGTLGFGILAFFQNSAP